MPLRHQPGARLAQALVCLLLLTARDAAASVLREARIDVAFTTPRHCEVAATFTVEVDAGSEIEHRLLVLDEAAVTMGGEDGGARLVGPPAAVGRSRALRVTLERAGSHVYTLRYQVVQPEDSAYRCPIWLPTAPTDGRAKAVGISVALPEGAQAGGGTLPAFAWDGRRGQTRVGHVPAFVRVPFRVAGEAAGGGGLNVTRLMDAIAILALAGGTALFVWRRRRR